MTPDQGAHAPTNARQIVRLVASRGDDCLGVRSGDCLAVDFTTHKPINPVLPPVALEILRGVI